MKLAIMTKPTFFVEEDKILSSLFDEGLECLHLSKPGLAPIYYERLLSLLPSSTHRRLIVHDHYYLKNEYDLAGIHINDMDAPTPRGYKGKVSRSCMDLSRLREMKKCSDYVLLKNIFDSIELSDEKASFTIKQLESAASAGLIDKHVYAMGGITAERISIVRQLGFGGVVICGDLWNHFSIHNQQDYEEIITYFGKLRKAAG